MNRIIGDRYELGAVVASGGMATVWRARDTVLDRDVAVKRPHPTAPDNPERQRLVREAKAAASIAHPNIVTVFDAGEDDDGPYLVMELIEASSLDEISAELTPSDAVAVIAQVADALDAVHRAGIVHRDVKPSNILMPPGGSRLTDFGIAHNPAATHTLTDAESIIATPQYAAPEVMAGETPSPAADVFSLGVVAYELLAGKPPFHGTDRTTRPTPLSEPSIDSVVSAALSTDPAERPDAALFGIQMRSASPTLPLAVTPTADPGPGVAPTLPMATIPLATLPGDLPPEDAQHGAPRSLRMGLWVAAGLLTLLLLIAATAVTLNNGESVAAAVPTSTTTTATSIQTTTTSTSSPSTTEPAPTVESVREEIAVLVNAIHPSDLKPKDSRSILKRIDEAIERFSDGEDPDKVADKIEDAIEQVEDKVEDGTGDEILTRIAQLATLLGVDFETDD